jgi:N-acetylmuramic acid 6-phosphate etherase
MDEPPASTDARTAPRVAPRSAGGADRIPPPSRGAAAQTTHNQQVGSVGADGSGGSGSGGAQGASANASGHVPRGPGGYPDPPDRAHIDTERRNPRTRDLGALDVEACLRRINAEDHLVPAAVERAIPAIARFTEAAAARMAPPSGGRLIYLGCGTSGRLGVLDASECPPTFMTDPGLVVGLIAGGDAALRRSSEGLEDDPRGAVGELDRIELRAQDAVLGLAAGGTTPWVRGGLEEAARRGALTGLLTCAAIEPPLGVEHLIFIDTGPEPLTGSTRMKAGTATKLALNMISTTLMVQAGKVHENLMFDLRATNDKLLDRAARIVVELTGASRAEAFDLLDRAGGRAKTAVVMQIRGLTADQAECLLAAANGRLAAALAELAP